MTNRAAALIELASQEPLPPDAVSRASAALEDADPEVRAAAIDAIGRLSALRHAEISASVAARVVDRTRDDDHRVRAEAASALAMLETPPEGAGRALRLLLDDPHSRVRQESCAALGDLGDLASRELLVEHLDDVDPEVRFEAAFALASLKDSRARELLESALSVTRKRLDACEALRRLGDPASLDALDKLTSKMFLAWVDRLAALAAMFALGRSDAGDKVLERTTSRNREERTYALSLIGSHKIRSGREILEHVARDERDPLRDTAVRALGELGDAAALPTLNALKNGSDRNLAFDVEAALEKINRP